jgi:RecA/RadA recombinase
MITTTIPALNVALSGQLDGGFVPGITLWCGPSKMGKSFFSLLMAKAYMDKYPDAVCIFMDCEFGIPTQYFVKLGIDMDRVVHVPIMNIEEFKFYVMKQLDGLTRNDRVVFVVDSLGNMASVKSQTDAIDGKDKTDMTRAKELRSIFRMITPYLNKLNIPFIAVNHVYLEQGCLAENTLVKTTNGTKPISSMKVGDKVYGTSGIQTVDYIYTPDELSTKDKIFLELSFDDGSAVKCTGNHKYLNSNGDWVEAKDLLIGDTFI